MEGVHVCFRAGCHSQPVNSDQLKVTPGWSQYKGNFLSTPGSRRAQELKETQSILWLEATASFRGTTSSWTTAVYIWSIRQCKPVSSLHTASTVSSDTPQSNHTAKSNQNNDIKKTTNLHSHSSSNSTLITTVYSTLPALYLERGWKYRLRSQDWLWDGYVFYINN